MAAVLNITAPIFILIAIGFFLIKAKLIEKTHIGGLGTFVVYLALPALIFNTLTKTAISDVIQPVFMIIYAAGSLLTFALGFLVYRKLFNKSFTYSTLNSFGGSISNSAFIGYPILLQTFSDPPIAAFTMAVIVESILILPLGLLLLELGETHGKGHALHKLLLQIGKRLLSNPIILSIVFGLLLSTLNIHLPSVFEKSIGMLAQASAPVALIFIGATLAASKWQGKLNDVLTVASFKLLVHPAMVFMMILLLPPLGGDLPRAALLIAAAPMVTIFPVISSKYGYGPQAASTLLVATVLAFFSISFILWLTH